MCLCSLRRSRFENKKRKRRNIGKIRKNKPIHGPVRKMQLSRRQLRAESSLRGQRLPRVASEGIDITAIKSTFRVNISYLA